MRRQQLGHLRRFSEEVGSGPSATDKVNSSRNYRLQLFRKNHAVGRNIFGERPRAQMPLRQQRLTSSNTRHVRASLPRTGKHRNFGLLVGLLSGGIPYFDRCGYVHIDVFPPKKSAVDGDFMCN